MPSDAASYESYRKYAALIGAPVLDFETWSRTRFKLDRHESAATAYREKWLAEDAKKNTNLATR